MISYIEEFDRQWSDLSSAMYVELSEQLRGFGIRLDRLNEVYRDERDRWRTPSQVNCSWLEMLRRTHPDAAAAFQDLLYSLELEPEEEAKSASVLPAIAGGCAGAALGYFAASALSPWSPVVNAAVGAAVGVGGGLCVSALTSKKNAQLREQNLDKYLLQVARHGEALRALLPSQN